jgi:site-specific recombinase XerD
MIERPLGSYVHAFSVHYLAAKKGLRPASMRSYRDALRLFLAFVANDAGCAPTRLTLCELTSDRVVRFLLHLETDRRNSAHTRNQRLAALRAWFAYLASRVPEMLDVGRRVAEIRTVRATPCETSCMSRDQIAMLFARLPTRGPLALRDRVLLLTLYNTGAHAQEIADLRVKHLNLAPPAHVRLHGRGGAWRTCPLWLDTAREIRRLLEFARTVNTPDAPVFLTPTGRPLSRFGIYKLVRRHARAVESPAGRSGRITPRVLCHTAAVHLVKAGFEWHVIRRWMGHADPAALRHSANYAAPSSADPVLAGNAPADGGVARHRTIMPTVVMVDGPADLACIDDAIARGTSRWRR